MTQGSSSGPLIAAQWLAHCTLEEVRAYVEDLIWGWMFNGTDHRQHPDLIDYAMTWRFAPGRYIQSIHNRYEPPASTLLSAWADDGQGHLHVLLHACSEQYPDPGAQQVSNGFRRKAEWLRALTECFAGAAADASGSGAGGSPTAQTRKVGAVALEPLRRLSAGPADPLRPDPDAPPLDLVVERQRPHGRGDSRLADFHSMPVPYVGSATAVEHLNALYDAAQADYQESVREVTAARAAFLAAYYEAWPDAERKHKRLHAVPAAIEAEVLEWSQSGCPVDERQELAQPADLSRRGLAAMGRFRMAQAGHEADVRHWRRICGAQPAGHDFGAQQPAPDGRLTRCCRRCGGDLESLSATPLPVSTAGTALGSPAPTSTPLVDPERSQFLN